MARSRVGASQYIVHPIVPLLQAYLRHVQLNSSKSQILLPFVSLQIQDEGVQHLAGNCRNLQTLNLHSCEVYVYF